jgi:hypothetical protein
MDESCTGKALLSINRRVDERLFRGSQNLTLFFRFFRPYLVLHDRIAEDDRGARLCYLTWHHELTAITEIEPTITYNRPIHTQANNHRCISYSNTKALFIVIMKHMEGVFGLHIRDRFLRGETAVFATIHVP